MKKLLTTLILLAIIGLITTNYKQIIKFAMYNFIYKSDFVYGEINEYKRDSKWGFVQETDDFEPNSKQDILNIFYTGINNGWSDFTFFCPDEYTTCMDDVNSITSDSILLSNINNFVSAFNSYNKILVNVNSFGRINIQVDRLYDNVTVELLNTKITEVYNSLITSNMNTSDKIKVIHDYIINNTKYDEERSIEVKSGNITSLKHSSNTAYGPLFTHKAICGGYADAMALFLDKMDIPNYKVSSLNHIWNFLYIDGSWKHLDLTWDDPVLSNGDDELIYTFYLIDTTKLEEIDTGQHVYSKDIFIEAK